MDEQVLHKMVKVLESGGVVVFPTDTVWGVGVDSGNDGAIRRMYQIKNREAGKPTALLVANLSQAKTLGEFNEKALALAWEHWPGALTVIVPKASDNTVSSLITGEGGFVGLRAPDSELIQKAIEMLGRPLVASSANFSGGEAPTRRVDVDPKLSEYVDYVVDTEEETSGKASTVVRVNGNDISVLRQGEVQL